VWLAIVGQCAGQEDEALVATSLLFVLTAVCGADDLGSSPPAARGLHEYHADISDLLKREALAKDPHVRAAAVVSDERFTTSDKLKEYRSRLWSRLSKVKTELKQQLAREARQANEPADDIDVLATADPAAVAAADSLASSLSLLDQAQGGPGRLLSFGGGALIDANGRALVDLIERTINPAFWDVVGGPGTIVYYAPLQCLVVRATSEIHGQVGRLADDLRAAGP
jgi:hypothetical protein